ncbi:MAG: 3-deoxy-manno-octulosonate cytidylyltransferase [Oleiphilus sp.]|nr:MAG: 3-deoxy-manno-octulosonate cytidylyltransferase [Oleiphilus sp.]
MSYIVVIPARYASTRLPGKPLRDIHGKPMIQRVVEQAARCSAAEVVVATDDRRIVEAVESFGGQALMTSGRHLSGTDRLQEVADKLALADDAVIVNVQGDEPLIPPAVIDQVARNLADHPEAGIATLCERIHDVETVFNPNAVKVVFDDLGFASYFSRAPIPWSRSHFYEECRDIPSGAEYYRHIGIYAYRVGFLHDYVKWQPAMIELTESLEQLRALSKGVRIHIEVACENPPAGVDTEEDLERVCDIFNLRDGNGQAHG